MASPYYVWSGAGGTASGADWTNAFTTFAAAVTAANADGDIIKVHKAHTEELGADTTYTFTNTVQVIVVDKDASDALATMGTAAWIGNSTTNRTVSIVTAVNKPIYIYGLTIRISGTITDDILIAAGSVDGSVVNMESCYLWQGNTNTASLIRFGSTGTAGLNAYVNCKNCTFRFGATAQSIRICARVDMVGCSIASAGSAPSTIFQTGSNPSGTGLNATGCDFSSGGTTAIIADSTNLSCSYIVSNSKLNASFIGLATQTNGLAGAELFLFDCDGGDNHYAFCHYNGLGSTIMDTGIYVADGALYDGTNHVTWKIVTTSSATFYNPYRAPWIEKYWSATSAISPYFEVLRTDSATAFNDDECWAEFSAKATASSTQHSFVNDRCVILATGAAQGSSAKGAGDWTGEGATPWFGKLGVVSITPAELGMLRGRVCVGKASATLYVDPTIRT